MEELVSFFHKSIKYVLLHLAVLYLGASLISFIGSLLHQPQSEIYGVWIGCMEEYLLKSVFSLGVAGFLQLITLLSLEFVAYIFWGLFIYHMYSSPLFTSFDVCFFWALAVFSCFIFVKI